MGGLYMVTITSGVGTCVSTATVNVTINETPIAFAPAVPAICAGNTLNLSSSNTNSAITSGLSYLWSGPSGYTSATQNPSRTSATVGMGGLYMVTITSGVGTCVSTATVNVTINVLPTLSFTPPTICAGTATTLTPTSNATTFAWSGGATGTSLSISVSPTVPTAYTLTVTNSLTPACSVTQTYWIDVKALPAVEFTTIASSCLGKSSQGNGQLMLNKYRTNEQVSWNIGSSYVGTPTSTTFAAVPPGGVFKTGLPDTAADYTVRVQNSTTFCYKDYTAPMPTANCPCPVGYCEPATIVKTK
jgi:hypothetical protein